MTYGFCVYHEIECDYKGSCIDCPHNTAEDTEWFRQDEERVESEDEENNMTDKEKISELINLVEVLCDNISDQPAGCDGCWLEEDGVCGKKALYEKMKVESGDEG